MKEFIKKHQYLLWALGFLFVGVMWIVSARVNDVSAYMLLAVVTFFVAALHALRYFLGRAAPDEPDDVGVFFWVVRHFRKKESDTLD